MLAIFPVRGKGKIVKVKNAVQEGKEKWISGNAKDTLLAREEA